MGGRGGMKLTREEKRREENILPWRYAIISLFLLLLSDGSWPPGEVPVGVEGEPGRVSHL